MTEQIDMSTFDVHEDEIMLAPGGYNTFEHIDTCGSDAKWKGSKTPQSDFDCVSNY